MGGVWGGNHPGPTRGESEVNVRRELLTQCEYKLGQCAKVKLLHL